jgi:hypothetical protein
MCVWEQQHREGCGCVQLLEGMQENRAPLRAQIAMHPQHMQLRQPPTSSYAPVSGVPSVWMVRASIRLNLSPTCVSE